MAEGIVGEIREAGLERRLPHRNARHCRNDNPLATVLGELPPRHHRDLLASELLRNEDRAGPCLQLGFPIRCGHLIHTVFFRENLVGDLPGLQNGLCENGTGISTDATLVGKIAAHSHDQEKRQFQIVDNIAQRIAGFEQSRALNHHNGLTSAQQETSGERHRFALAANPQQPQVLDKPRLPLAQLAIGNPDRIRSRTKPAEASAARHLRKPSNMPVPVEQNL